jgi:hypothetical protein
MGGDSVTVFEVAAARNARVYPASVTLNVPV